MRESIGWTLVAGSMLMVGLALTGWWIASLGFYSHTPLF